MDRRKALFSIAAATGGITLLSRCSFGEERLPIALNNLNVSVGQEDLLKDVVSVILPETDIPGATSLEAHNFVWVMVDDCFSSPDQEKFMAGLSGFTAMTAHIEGREYGDFKAEEKAELLGRIRGVTEVENVPAGDGGAPVFDLAEVHYFLDTTKRFTVQGFMQSQYVMTDIMPYALVPGSSTGCADVDPNKRVNIYG